MTKPLHECSSANEFLATLNDPSTGSPLINNLLSSFAPVGIVLVGSIPLGLGRPTSDLDFILLQQPDRGRVRSDLAGAGRLLYQGATPDESGTTRVRLIVAVGGHEVDVSVVNLQWIAGLAARARRANVSIEPFEACVLSRLKTGWVLTADDSTLNWLCEWKADLSLEIHMTVSYFVFANQLLDDADAAIDEDPQLATILARRAVDRLFEAFLSSRGYAYAGPKWLRLLRKLLSDGSAEWSSAGLDLLSKGASGREQSAQLLSDARCFMRTIRQKLDAEPAYKTALAICPQLEWRR